MSSTPGAAAGQRADRAGADGVDANAARAEIVGQVLHGRIEGRLADAHHVVARHRLLAAEIGHRQRSARAVVMISLAALATAIRL